MDTSEVLTKAVKQRSTYDFDAMFEAKILKYLTKDLDLSYPIKTAYELNSMSRDIKIVVQRPGKSGISFADLLCRFNKTKAPELLGNLEECYGSDSICNGVITVVDRVRVGIFDRYIYEAEWFIQITVDSNPVIIVPIDSVKDALRQSVIIP